MYQSDGNDSYWEDVGKAFVANKFFGEHSNCLDPKVIEQDIKRLELVSDGSSSYTDRRLAHLDKREPDSIPTLSEVEEWCEVLNDVLKKFMLLIHGVDYKVEPILQHDWKSIFRTAWL
ncbi:MAG: hypothetical protein L3J98_06595 [Gammaproteobacteria bacterium]|nr:hypothetical protein [Gammaproteobacteria bacterium]